MRSILWLVAVGSLFCLSEGTVLAQQKAFVGAEGFGASATGGRGGSVYHVTTLEDGNIEGSLRWGVNTHSGPTTIVFDVGGTIRLTDGMLWITGDLTIAGQTAPGGGISVAGNTLGVLGNNTIIRYVRSRLDNRTNGMDAMTIASSNNVILDHVSTAWGMDGTMDLTLSNNVTVQNSIIGQTLTKNGHSYASLVRGNVTPDRQGGYTFARNLWCHNDLRNPGIGSRQDTSTPYEHATLELDMVNNVIYNWGRRAIHNVQSEDDMNLNLVGNMFIAGSNTSSPNTVLTLESGTSKYNGNVNLYESGNKIDSDKDAIYDPVAVTRSAYSNTGSSDIIFQATRHDFPAVTALDADAAYTSVLANVGASLVRDSLDSAFIDNVRNRTGSIINTNPACPIIAGGVALTDTDQDGMPDSWERWLGLNPNNAADGNGIATNIPYGGYTNLEVYLGALAGDFVVVPEPGSLALLVTAFVTLLTLRRRFCGRRP